MSGFGFSDAFPDGAADPVPSAAARPKKNMRADIYAKSREQRMVEANEELEYQQAVEKERLRQKQIEEGFGGDMDDGGAGPSSPDAPRGFQIWGQAKGGAAPGFVAPPFVPRDKRSNTSWDVGLLKKSESDKLVLAGSHGEFLIRETTR